MTSALQDIAETLATDFRDAVIDAEKADMDTIDKIIQDLNQAYHDFDVREKVLDTKAEEAVRTLKEVSDLRDVNITQLNRRIEALRELLSTFRETKVTTKKKPVHNADNPDSFHPLKLVAGTDP
jgi:predicted  nucleic acid-binding Zn-ribbon protein